MMVIESESLIDAHGEQYLLVTITEPQKNSLGLWTGGEILEFRLNHRKLTTAVYSFHWENGVAAGFKTVKLFKDEILGKGEMLTFAEDYKKRRKSNEGKV